MPTYYIQQRLPSVTKAARGPSPPAVTVMVTPLSRAWAIFAAARPTTGQLWPRGRK